MTVNNDKRIRICHGLKMHRLGEPCVVCDQMKLEFDRDMNNGTIKQMIAPKDKMIRKSKNKKVG